jgi:hypothetical protein
VLLSMLTLCLAHHRDGSPLPTTLLELYSAAMSGAMLAAGHADGDRMSADAWTVIKRAATSNMLSSARREFTSDDVLKALGDKGLSMWEKLEAADGSVPLVKILEQKTVSSPAFYQFRHLSFQEALFAEELTACEAAADWAGWRDDQAAAKSLMDPSLRNTFRIGGGACSNFAFVQSRVIHRKSRTEVERCSSPPCPCF